MLHEQIEPLLTILEVAAILGIPKATLYKWHHARTGPTFFRVGKHLRCEPAELQRFIDEKREEG